MHDRLNASLAFLVLNLSAASCRQRTDQSIEWTAYAHDAQGSKYSPAAQVNRANVSQLAVAWTYRTGDFARGDGAARDETTPLYVDGTLYLSTPFGGVRALNGETGEEIWSFDADLDLSGHYGDFTNRGVSTWLDPGGREGSVCRRRIFIATVSAQLIALDAASGKPCPDFGERGQVHLDRGLANEPGYPGEYAVTSPPAVIDGLVIVGSSVSDGGRAAAPEGTVRAFDARSGSLRWHWDPVPGDSSDPAFTTWRGPAAHRTGAANAWSVMSVDSARDLVFIPTGSASPDFFGGERLGENRYANSVVALHASTGRLVWHFQVVHHDLWDYDVPAQPALLTLHRDGRDIPALVQATKMGHLFVLNRETGQPLFPVEERPVPASDVKGEQASPTQPFPTVPAPLVPTSFTSRDVFALSDVGRAWCMDQVRGARSEGIFTPPSVRGTVIYPGNVGGSNWSGVALDPGRKLAIVPSNRIVTMVNLIPRAELRERERSGTRFDEFAPQSGTAYAMRRRHLIAPDGVPCNPPPWGTLTAIDLETGATRWEHPFGSVAPMDAVRAGREWGSPNIGGAMVTAGGLLFAGGALDQRLYAYDIETGAELWSAVLPAGVHAAPMTYTTTSGQQFIVVAAGGHKELRDRLGDFVVAFAIPRAGTPATVPGVMQGGHYEGHVVLDRTRARMSWELNLTDSVATVTLETADPHVTGQGHGRATRDSLWLDIDWTFASRNCSGTMTLRGAPANGGRSLVGELDYVDGCEDGSTKPGTFALWRGSRRESHLDQ